MQNLINNTYEHKLAYIFHKIDNRGIFIDEKIRGELGHKVHEHIDDLCGTLSKNWGFKVYVGRENKDGSSDALNLNSSSGENSLIKRLQGMGFKVPKIRVKNKDGEFEHKESANELALRRLYGETSDDNIGRILDIRELVTLKNRYINARLYNGVFYCNYNVAATVTGRRGSKKHIFNLGGNAQNFPKHSELGKEFRRCLVSRPGKIFFSVDQIQAEDWAVSALAQNLQALDDLRNGVDRHRKLACAIFNLPWDHYSDNDWKESIERYLGKKTRHARNYGMRGQRFSDILTAEKFPMSAENCQILLDRAGKVDPNVDAVFHKYIKDELYANRILKTPFGRERQFFGLRPNSENYEVLNEAYSYIPQSTIGDNTGLAILFLDDFLSTIIADGHDSILSEPEDREDDILLHYDLFRKSFDREITFHNGISLTIPIEGEIGYSLATMVKIKEWSEEGVLKAWKKAKEERVVETLDASQT